MVQGASHSGYITVKELKEKGIFPSKERQHKGPVAVLECFQQIPCDPCSKACPVGAMKIGGDLTELPILDAEACTGCKLCLAACPGQAVFVVDYHFSKEEGTVTFPYEFLPLPEKDMILPGVDRKGDEVCSVRIVKVENRKAFNKTVLVTVAVPRQWMEEVRFIRYRRDGGMDDE